jgi:hypothetical protein
MVQIDLAAIAATLENRYHTVTFVDSDSPKAPEIPAQWRGIAESDDAEQRRLSAMTLWNRDFLALVPGYAEALRTKLADVRPCVFSDEGPALVYIFDAGASTAVWIGRDPAGFGDTPVYWESLPVPARTFLREVHAGYSLSGRGACGLARPRNMTTLAEKWSETGVIPDWLGETWFPDCERIDPHRVMYVTHTSETFELATSPDLPPGKALIYHDGEANMVSFGEELDAMMQIRL